MVIEKAKGIYLITSHSQKKFIVHSAFFVFLLVHHPRRRWGLGLLIFFSDFIGSDTVLEAGEVDVPLCYPVTITICLHTDKQCQYRLTNLKPTIKQAAHQVRGARRRITIAS